MVNFAVVLLISVPARPQSPPAQTLTVHLFSSVEVKKLQLTPLGTGATLSPCPACPNEPLAKPFEIESTPSLRPIELSGSFRITAANRDITASGKLHIAPSKSGLRMLLDLPSDRYVVAALNGEAAPDEPLASLKSMAVAIRTFGLANARRHAAEGFGLCDDTHCQSLRFEPARPEVEQAVLETAGETLWFKGRRASVYYAQNCGGTTEDVTAVWPGLHAPYLVAHADPYCIRRDRAAWHADLPLDRLAVIFRAEGWKMPARIDSARIAKLTPSGRVALLEFNGNGTRATVSASSLRFAVDRALGWNTMRGDNYQLNVAGGVLHLDGRGFGHGVGLCQAGAFEMATEGRAYRDILAFYFPGTSVRVTSTDTGWASTEASGWSLRSVSPSLALKLAGDAAWARALHLFPPRAPIKPTVFAAPTTELFRQISGEPGWTLAATRGTQVFLQPGAILRAHAAESSTLLHEFLHVLVESEAAPNVPLWLREGLVEALAEPAPPPSHRPFATDLDAALAHPATQAESQRAHAAAADRVAGLIVRFGLPTVRGWLRTGVPTSVP